MLTHRQLAARRAAWLARHRKTHIYRDRHLGQTNAPIATSVNLYQDMSQDPTADMTDYGYNLDTGNPLSTDPYTTDTGSTSGSGLTTGWGGILSSIGNFFKGGASAPPQSYAAAQGQPLTSAPGSYSATLTTPQGQYGASVTTPQSAPPASTFSLSSLTDFSTPWPYILIGGGILLLAKSRGGGGGSGSENFIKL